MNQQLTRLEIQILKAFFQMNFAMNPQRDETYSLLVSAADLKYSSYTRSRSK